MSKLKDSVANVVLQRVAQYDIAPPTDLDSYVDEVELAIQNYCGISQVPAELKFVWVCMVIDYLRWVERQKKPSSGSRPQQSSTPTVLSSIKEGDTTLGFSADTAATEYQVGNSHKMTDVLDRIVMNYENALNRFRRVVW